MWPRRLACEPLDLHGRKDWPVRSLDADLALKTGLGRQGVNLVANTCLCWDRLAYKIAGTWISVRSAHPPRPVHCLGICQGQHGDRARTLRYTRNTGCGCWLVSGCRRILYRNCRLIARRAQRLYSDLRAASLRATCNKYLVPATGEYIQQVKIYKQKQTNIDIHMIHIHLRTYDTYACLRVVHT